MKKNVGMVVLLVVFVVLAAVVVSQRQQIARLKAQPPATIVKIVTNQPPAMPDAVMAAPPVPQAPKPVVTASLESSLKSKFMAGLADMMKNPQMREMMRAQQEVMINQSHL